MPRHAWFQSVKRTSASSKVVPFFVVLWTRCVRAAGALHKNADCPASVFYRLSFVCARTRDRKAAHHLLSHISFLSGCAVETREFRGTASASNRVFPQPASGNLMPPLFFQV